MSADDGTGGGARAAQPYLCPFCGEEDLRPHDHEGRAVWHCRSCLRLFSLSFHGLAPSQASSLIGAAPDDERSEDR